MDQKPFHSMALSHQAVARCRHHSANGVDYAFDGDGDHEAKRQAAGADDGDYDDVRFADDEMGVSQMDGEQAKSPACQAHQTMRTRKTKMKKTLVEQRVKIKLARLARQTERKCWDVIDADG